MIERQFVKQKMNEYMVEDYIAKTLKNVGHSHTRMIKTPIGEKIIIYAARPGLIVGQKGANIKELTETIKKKFGLENPQIEIVEVENTNLDAQIVAEKIASALERFGTAKMKGIAHKVLSDTMNAGALGIEVVISGKIPSARAKSWRFYQGYMKKCGNIAQSDVRKAYSTAFLKSGNVGIKVSIMPPDIKLPDRIKIIDKNGAEEKEQEKIEAESAENKKNENKEETKKVKKNRKNTESKKQGKKTAAENNQNTEQ